MVAARAECLVALRVDGRADGTVEQMAVLTEEMMVEMTAVS